MKSALRVCLGASLVLGVFGALVVSVPVAQAGKVHGSLATTTPATTKAISEGTKSVSQTKPK